MSMRQEWKFNGQYFAKTSTERGGLRFFIDGKPTRRLAWLEALTRAEGKEERERRRANADQIERELRCIVSRH